MQLQAIRSRQAPDEFARYHRLFLQHFGMAVGFAWVASICAAAYAPWVRNFRGLLDPLARAESTWSFLFGLPALMTVAWILAAVSADAMRRSRVLKSQALEFGLAGLVAFAVFCTAIDRAVTAYLLGH